MRPGFSDKEASVALRVRPAKVSQSLMPAAEKFARLWRIDPSRTIALIQSIELEPMSDAEIALRERLLSGRVDRDAVRRC